MSRRLRTEHRPRHLRELTPVGAPQDAARRPGPREVETAAQQPSAQLAMLPPSTPIVSDRSVEAPDAPGTEPSAADPLTAEPRRSSNLGRATALMASGSIVSRMLGFVRNYLFGVITAGSMTAAASAFSSANLLPNTIWILVGGGTLNAILVPAIVRAARRPDRGSNYVSRLMTLVVMISAALTALCIVAVPLLLTLTSGTLPPATFALAVQLGYWMMPQIMLSALYVMCGQLLNAHDSFGPYQWAPVMNNLVGILGGAVFLLIWGQSGDPSTWTLGMIITLAAINVGGSGAQVLFLFWFVRKLRLRLRPKWGFRGLGFGKLSKLGLWTLAMLLIAQVGIWATRWATGNAVDTVEDLQGTPEASLYPALTTIDWAYMAFMIPQGIIAVTIVTAVFPRISRSAADASHSEALRQYARTARLLALPMFLCTAVFIILAGPIMWVIGGGTEPPGARANSWVLIGYMLGLVPFAATYLVKRVFYAYEDARAPFWMQIPNTVISLLAVAPILMLVDPRYATATAAAVSSLGNIGGWALGLILLRRRAVALGASPRMASTGVRVYGKLVVATVLSMAVGAGAMWLAGDVIWIHRVVAVLLGGVIAVLMAAVFAGAAWLLRIEELTSMMSRVTRKLGRSEKSPASTS